MRWLTTAAIAAVLAASGCGGGNAYAPPPPAEVTVAHPLRRAVTSYLEYTGTTRGVESVELRARVKGFLREIHFAPGAEVQAGDLLMVIEEEPFAARLDVARAKLAEAESTLRKAEQSKGREVARAGLALDQAALLLTRVEESRQRNLVTRNAASKEEYDRAEANRKKAEAQVDSDEASREQAVADYDTNILAGKALVASAKADVRTAEIDLGYCRIVAPVSGRISRNLVDKGNYVGDGQATLLGSIVKYDPIFVYLTVSESDLLRFQKQLREGKRQDYRQHPLRLDLGLADEKGFPHEGRLDYADPSVDPATGTITCRGVFPNPGFAVVPGLFARVRVALEQVDDALLVPEAALSADQTGRFLLVVGKGDVVEQRSVTVGAEVDGMRAVAGKLDPAEWVVVNGLQRARPGSKVKPVQAGAVAPPAATAVAAGKAPQTP